MAEEVIHRDDAPPITSKRSETVKNVAGTLLAARGDTAAGWAVTINRPIGELFVFYRNFANLATFMENVERIDVRDDRRSHWVVKAPGGKTVEWDAIVTDEAKDSFITWTSAEGADVANSGRIEFRDAGDRGTVVTATLFYDPPAGTIGKLIAKLFQREPAIQARRDLRRFKQLMETGEIATSARTHQQFAEENA